MWAWAWVEAAEEVVEAEEVAEEVAEATTALHYVEGVLGQRIDGVGLVYHPNCGISRLAHGQVDPLIDGTPPVDDGVVLPFCTALSNGDSRGHFAKRSKEIVDVAKCPEGPSGLGCTW